MTLKSACQILATVLFPLSGLLAQTMTVSSNLSSGGSAKITYEDPSQANQTVQLTIDNGIADPALRIVVTVTMELNSQGKAVVNWLVPNWNAAKFNAPGVNEITRVIL